MFGALDPDRVLSLAFIATACIGLTVWALKGKILSLATHLRALAEKDAQIARMRQDHAEQIAAQAAQFAVMLASKDTDLDKLWAAWHLESASNQEQMTVLMEEMSSSSNLVTAMAQALDRARSQEVAPSDNGATGAARTGRGRGPSGSGRTVRPQVEMGPTPPDPR